MKTRRRYVLPILVVAALVSSTAARAASVVLNDTWQNLGTGPFLLQTLGGDGVFEASASAPTDTGLALGKNQVPFAYNSTLSIWGKRRSPSYTTTVIYSPLTIASGGGGGGGGGAVYGNNATGTAPSQPPVFTSGVDAAGNIKPFLARADGSEGVFMPDTRAVSQTLSPTAGSFIDIPVNGQNVVGLRFTGLAASGATITYYSSNDATQTPTSPISSLNAATGVTSPNRTTDGETRVPVSGRTTLRLQVTTAGTSSITVSYNVGSVGNIVDLASPLPAGSNVIGSISNTAFGISGTLPPFATTPTVTVGNFPATQPVSVAALPLPTGASTSALQTSVQGSVVPGTAATSSSLGGQVYNSTPPAPTSGQQTALQSDNYGATRVTESAPNVATAQAAATVTAAQICAARTGRRAVTITNITGTAPVYYGATGVTTTTGGYLGGTAGSSVTLNTSAAIFGVVATTTQTVSCTDTY